MLDFSMVEKDSQEIIKKLKATAGTGQSPEESARNAAVKRIDAVIKDISENKDSVKGWFKPLPFDDSKMLVCIRSGRYPVIVDKNIQDENGMLVIQKSKAKAFFEAQKKIIQSGEMDKVLLDTANQKPKPKK